MGSVVSWLWDYVQSLEAAIDEGGFTYYLLMIFVLLVLYLAILRPGRTAGVDEEPEPQYERPEKRDMTVTELLEYDGRDPNKALLLAVCGNIYDVTRGKGFYGPGGPYAVLAGHDATRGLATMNAGADAVKNTVDDHSDISRGDMSKAQEWDQMFAFKYDRIGALLTSEPPGAESGLSDQEEGTTSDHDEKSGGEEHGTENTKKDEGEEEEEEEEEEGGK